MIGRAVAARPKWLCVVEQAVYSMSFNENYMSRGSNKSYKTMAIDACSVGTMYEQGITHK